MKVILGNPEKIWLRRGDVHNFEVKKGYILRPASVREVSTQILDIHNISSAILVQSRFDSLQAARVKSLVKREERQWSTVGSHQGQGGESLRGRRPKGRERGKTSQWSARRSYAGASRAVGDLLPPALILTLLPTFLKTCHALLGYGWSLVYACQPGAKRSPTAHRVGPQLYFVNIVQGVKCCDATQ